MICVLYKVRYESKPTHRLVVSGGIPQFGEWDLARAIPLRRSEVDRDRNVWRCEVKAPSVNFEYAFVEVAISPGHQDVWYPKREARLYGKAETEPVICITDDGFGDSGLSSDRRKSAMQQDFLALCNRYASELGMGPSALPTPVQTGIVNANHKVRRLRQSWMALRDDVSELLEFGTDLSPLYRLREMTETEQQSRTQLSAAYVKESRERRALVEQIQALRGKIRVLVRVRPNLESESDLDCAVVPIDDTTLCIRDKIFTFDGVLGPFSTQADLFDEVEDVVASCMDGFTCSVFSYGATNSGKTYSMEGPEHDRGVSFRSIRKLFELREQRASSNESVINLSVVEVYNDAIYDLLDPNDDRSPLEVMTATNVDDLGRVNHLTWLSVDSTEDAWASIQSATRSRSVGATRSNERSSRSHLVVCITVQSTDLRSGTRLIGKLALVDLAGSERLRVSGAVGDRLRESQAINKSLSALSNVFRALSGSGEQHVPFRDSRLTFLLQDYLNMSARVISIVHVSPCSGPSVDESLCSLRFAERVKAVVLGPATRRLESSEYVKHRAALQAKDRTIERLQFEIATLRSRLAPNVPSTSCSPGRKSPAHRTPKHHKPPSKLRFSSTNENIPVYR